MSAVIVSVDIENAMVCDMERKHQHSRKLARQCTFSMGIDISSVVEYNIKTTWQFTLRYNVV